MTTPGKEKPQAIQEKNAEASPALYAPLYFIGWTCGTIAKASRESADVKDSNNKDTGNGTETKKKKNVVTRFAKAVWVAGHTTVDALRENQGIKASLNSLQLKKTAGTSGEVQDGHNAAVKSARKIIRYFKYKKIPLKRIGIDGVPGSGKTTLSKALSELMGYRVKTLDYIDMNKPQDFSQSMTIYEHHRLFRTQNLDNFDALVYIDEPVKLSKKKCVHRLRGGYNIDIFDYNKLKKIGEKAFSIAYGKTHRIPDTYFKIKIRPKGGFNAYNNLLHEVIDKGNKTTRIPKEELLFLSEYGTPVSGLSAYVNFKAYNKEILKGISAGISDFFMSE